MELSNIQARVLDILAALANVLLAITAPDPNTRERPEQTPLGFTLEEAWETYEQQLHEAAASVSADPSASEVLDMVATVDTRLKNAATAFEIFRPVVSKQKQRVGELLRRISQEAPGIGQRSHFLAQCNDALTRLEPSGLQRAVLMDMLSGEVHDALDVETAWGALEPLCAAIINLSLDIHYLKEGSGLLTG